ncbi:MAG: hypothetical protein LBR80_10320 [Deltaproteobacteria bacterium]|jgi:hypothetical protein|nr:hypothetical protein [Deltaproteobacteria bacterium]
MAFLAVSAASEAFAHSLWLETPEGTPPADRRLRLDIGFNEGFELVDILDVAVGKIAASVLASESGETAMGL